MHWIDPNCLPETTGVIDCFLLNTEGEADGLILTDGTEVHFPRHMSRGVLQAVKPGGIVRLRGVRPRGVAMIAAVSIAAEEGASVVDDGPPEVDEGRNASRKQAHALRSAMEVSGVLRQVLHGPRDEVRGVLLEDGRAGRFPPHIGEDMASMLKPGTPLLLRGDGFVTEHGTVIAIGDIGTSADDLRPMHAKPTKKQHPSEHPPHEHGSENGKPKRPRQA